MAGWIKLHRSLKDWEWYDDINATRLLIHLLVTVNYEDKKWKGINVKAGSRITSFQILSDETGLSVKQIRTAMSKLEGAGEVTREGAKKGQAVTLVKWDKLQHVDGKEGNKKVTEIGSERATTKEGKEYEEEKNISVFSFDEFWIKYPKKVAKSKCAQKYKKLTETERTKIRDTLDKFIQYKPFKSYTHPNPETYLNQKRWEDEIPEPKDHRQINDNGIVTEQDYKDMFLKD